MTQHRTTVLTSLLARPQSRRAALGRLAGGGAAALLGAAGTRGARRPAAQAAPPTAELHICATTPDGCLWHGIREGVPGGSWLQPFEDVTGLTGFPCSFAGHIGWESGIDCAGVGGELHVCGASADGELFHTIRRGPSTWDPFANISAEVVSSYGGPASENIGMVGLAGNGKDLHVCAVVRHGAADSRVWYTFGSGPGAFNPPEDLNATTGFVSTAVSPYSSPIDDFFGTVDCAIAPGLAGSDELHIAALTLQTFADRTLFAMHGTSGTWGSSPWGSTPPGGWDDVKDAFGFFGGWIDSVAVAELGGELHAIALVDGRNVFHLRGGAAYGGWDTGFADNVLAGAEYDGKGLGFPAVSCANVSDHLHVTVVDRRGELWHAVWDPNRAAWVQFFESVHTASGFYEPFTQASLAGL